MQQQAAEHFYVVCKAAAVIKPSYEDTHAEELLNSKHSVVDPAGAKSPADYFGSFHMYIYIYLV